MSNFDLMLIFKPLFFNITLLFLATVEHSISQGWANSALRGICRSETVSHAHVVDGFFVLILKMTLLFWWYVIVKFKQRSIIPS